MRSAQRQRATSRSPRAAVDTMSSSSAPAAASPSLSVSSHEGAEPEVERGTAITTHSAGGWYPSPGPEGVGWVREKAPIDPPAPDAEGVRQPIVYRRHRSLRGNGSGLLSRPR